MPNTSITDSKKVIAMQLLGDRTRYEMFRQLCHNSNSCVSDFAKSLGISVSAVSQHFRQFEQIGFVIPVRQGLKICYQLNESDDLVIMFKKLINN